MINIYKKNIDENLEALDKNIDKINKDIEAINTSISKNILFINSTSEKILQRLRNKNNNEMIFSIKNSNNLQHSINNSNNNIKLRESGKILGKKNSGIHNKNDEENEVEKVKSEFGNFLNNELNNLNNINGDEIEKIEEFYVRLKSLGLKPKDVLDDLFYEKMGNRNTFVNYKNILEKKHDIIKDYFNDFDMKNSKKKFS